jgi:NADH dehydrogenase
MASVVTGAFGYIGKYIARRLLEQGEQVTTITNHPNNPNPFGNAVQALPYNFDKPDQLTTSLRGATALYNTYWIRFEYGGATFRQAVQNTITLFQCAKRAGVRKIVHISVTHASSRSNLPYFAGKGQLEEALINSGVPYGIVRPTVVFGKEDILVNNIAWLVRKFPFFPIFGTGNYRVQPVFVDDLAALAVARARDDKSAIVDAIGPETFSFYEFVRLIASKIKPQIKLLRMPPAIGISMGRLIGLALGDVILTRDELQGLMDNLLTSDQAPTGATRFSDWLESHKHEVGAMYSSELRRHFKWGSTA